MATRGVVDLGELGWVEKDGIWKKQDLSCFLGGFMREKGFVYKEGACMFVSERTGEDGEGDDDL